MITVNGTSLPPEETLKIDKEKIWSSNAGRLDNGHFAGDIIAIKHTLAVTWKRLSKAQTAIVNDCVDSDVEYSTVTYPDTDGTMNSGEFYFGTPSYQHVKIKGEVYCDITVNVIER